MSAAHAKLVLIGWHGADWKSIHPLVDAGLMPNLRSLIERGVVGNLKPGGPAVPAMLWTSIATGKTADQHGVLSGNEPDPLSGGVRPAGSASRRAKALWNIAMQSGMTAHVVGWCASHPAEKLNGSCVTPGFVRPLARYGAPWPVLPDSIYPKRLIPELAELRVHAGELTGAELHPFIPLLNQIDQEADRRVVAFADTLAQTLSTHAIATWLLEHESWDVMMIGWSGLQRACHLFMRYAAPQLPGMHPDDCARYGQVVRGMYSYHDALLGRIVQLAGPDATVAIVSAAGFRTSDERPVSAALQALPLAWYRPHGIFCLAGPKIVSDELVHGVTMLDVVPTMLEALGLPAGSDMPGRVVSEAFREAPADARIPSWEEVPGDCEMEKRSSAEPESSAEAESRAEAAIAELSALGYRDMRADAASMRIERERLYNTALVHMSQDRYAEARTVFLELQAQVPDSSLSLSLAYCHFRCRDFAACAAELRNAPSEGLAAVYAKMLESYLAAATGDTGKARAAIAAAERMGPDSPVVNWIVASLYVRLGQLGRAEAALRTAVELDPGFQQAHSLLARVLAARGKTAEAAAAARDGLSVDFASASLHSALGIALAQSGDEDGALKAFEASLAFDSQFTEAAGWVGHLTARARKSA
ncbi:MAG: alkaline phosphatase family protein [Bryobacteraceae bacterium]